MGAKSNNRVFTSGEVAQICGVSADTVSRWFDLGHIQGYRLGPGGDRRIPFDNLRTFMIGHGIPLERLEEQARSILIVDDDPYYLDIIAAVLSKLGDNKIILASTGFDAGAQVVDRSPMWSRPRESTNSRATTSGLLFFHRMPFGRSQKMTSDGPIADRFSDGRHPRPHRTRECRHPRCRCAPYTGRGWP